MSTLQDFLDHPIETLERALHIRKEIAHLQKTLKEMFGPSPISLAAIQIIVPERKGKRTVSAASRAKMAVAQKARWAKKPVTSSTPVKTAPVAKARKGGMSAEGRARIIAAQKALWAKVRAAKSVLAPAKSTTKAPATKGKRKMSPEARAKIAAAQKKRWAKVKIANEGQPKFKII